MGGNENPFAGIDQSSRRNRGVSKSKMGCLAALIVMVSVLAIGGVGYLIWKSGKMASISPLSSGPSTCREFAELLQAKGMDIRWVRCNVGSGLHGNSHPSIYIVRSEDCRHNAELSLADANGEISDRNLEIHLNEGYSWLRAKVIVRQHPTSQEATEEAGTRKADFAWGRFVVSGTPELVQEIRGKLR